MTALLFQLRQVSLSHPGFGDQRPALSLTRLSGLVSKGDQLLLVRDPSVTASGSDLGGGWYEPVSRNGPGFLFPLICRNGTVLESETGPLTDSVPKVNILT